MSKNLYEGLRFSAQNHTLSEIGKFQDCTIKIISEYRRGGSQADFRNLHQKEIGGFLKAEAYLKSIGMVKPDSRMLKQILENELMPLNQEITELRRMVELHKQDLRDTATIRQIYE